MKSFSRILSVIVVLFAFVATVPAAPIFNTESPVDFFTNVASRLLSSEMNLDLTRIEIYPTNQYTPAVHRLLQVSANIYEATTTNFYPAVFRPLFGKDLAGDVFITGYTNLNNGGVPNTVSGPGDPQLSTPFDVEVISALSGNTVASDVNIYGVPWIIGVKKGFPNFNEFSMENNLAVTRRLQLTRTTNSVVPVITGTNQMYVMSLNSSLGVELWNSYSSNYPGTILIGLNENASLMITNDDQGLHEWVLQPFSTNVLYSINSWPGAAPWYGGNANFASFVPITFPGPTLTNSVYRSSYYAGGPDLVPTDSFSGSVPFGATSSDGNGFYFPQFGVLMTNRLQVFMLDLTNGIYHVIDYVHFAGPDSAFNMNDYLADYDASNNYVGVWDTNYPPGSLPPTGTTYGIYNQITISRTGANPPTEDGQWQTDPEAVPLGGTKAQQAAYFFAFFIPGNHYGNVTNLQLSVVAPYSPTRYIVQYVTWQANDPLVHYLASDIDEPPLNNSTTPQPGIHTYNFPVTNTLTSLNLGQLNDRYMPWGGNPQLAAEGQELQFDPNAYNLAERDPLVYSPDDWNFSTGQPLNSSWLGQVHRGTPWQTIYLKSSDILANNGIATWQEWTGDSDATDAAAMAPVQDWHLASVLASLFNTNNFTTLFRVNNPNPNDWQGLLNGLTALTNDNSEVNPVLISSNSPQASLIASAIQSERALQPGQMFRDVGDVLATPQLAEQSPFINGANTNTFTDAACEIIPSQLLSLLRSDSIGSIALMNRQPVVRFTGYDGHPYAIQTSSDLVNWTSIGTNCPVNGAFSFTNSTPLNATSQFYRSILLQ
jgi:hypothetical protein